MSSSITQLTEENKITPQNFRQLYNELRKLTSASDKIAKVENDIKTLIESIIEYLIHGDKHDSLIFDVFCELNFMNEFINLSNQKSKVINLQIIKSFALLITNLTNKQNLYFLFSNNFINQIISGDYEKIDSDFLYYYVNFIKSLALKIDETTIQFFYHKQMNTFPLLANTLKFYNHPDPMISNVVRNIFLTIAKIRYEPVIEYMCGLPNLTYFIFITCRTRDLIKTLNKRLPKKKPQIVQAISDEIVNDILFFQDIFSLGIPKFDFILTNCIFNYIILPLVCGSISPKPLTQLPDGNPNPNIVSVEVAIYTIYLFIKYIKNENFINSIVSILFMKKIHYKILDKVNSPPPNLYNYESDWNNVVKAAAKKIKFREYIMINFNEILIRYLVYYTNSPFNEINTLIKKLEAKHKGINTGVNTNSPEIYKSILEELNKFCNDKEMGNMRTYHECISKATGIQCGLTFKSDRMCFLHLLNKTLKLSKQNYSMETDEKKYVDNTIRTNFFNLLKSKNKKTIQIGLILINTLFQLDYLSKELLAFVKFLTPEEITENVKNGKEEEGDSGIKTLNIGSLLQETQNDIISSIVRKKLPKEEDDKITFATFFPFTTKEKFKFTEFFLANNETMAKYLKNNQINYNYDFVGRFLNVILMEPPRFNLLINLLSLTNLKYLILLKEPKEFIPIDRVHNNLIKRFYNSNINEILKLLDQSRYVKKQCIELFKNEELQSRQDIESLIANALNDPYSLLLQEEDTTSSNSKETTTGSHYEQNKTEQKPTVTNTESDNELYQLRLLSFFYSYDLFSIAFKVNKINFENTQEIQEKILEEKEKKINEDNPEIAEVVDNVLKCKICTEVGQMYKEGTVYLNKENDLEIKIEESEFDLKVNVKNIEIQGDISQQKVVQLAYPDDKGDFKIMMLSFGDDDDAGKISNKFKKVIEIKGNFERNKNCEIMKHYFGKILEQFKQTK